MWLFVEPLLNKCGTKPAYNNKKLFQLAQKIYPNCNTALISFGGQTKDINSNAQIFWHRDANFALPRARGVNLGAKSIFGYDSDRYNTKEGAKSEQYFILQSGDIFEFDCKHRHALIKHEPGRFGIIFWKMRENYLTNN
jgi:hypothetical protein